MKSTAKMCIFFKLVADARFVPSMLTLCCFAHALVTAEEKLVHSRICTAPIAAFWFPVSAGKLISSCV